MQTMTHFSTVSALGIPRIVGTIDPRNVEHVLKSMYIMDHQRLY